MKINEISAVSVLQDFSRRKIGNDLEYTVNQGILKLWRLNNNLIAELHIDSKLYIRGRCVYLNTLSPQAIADDIIAESKITKTDVELWSASKMGKIGGAVKSKAKAKASKENGKKGGRPKTSS